MREIPQHGTARSAVQSLRGRVRLVDKVAGLGDVWVGELDGRFTERLDRIRGLLSHVARARPHARLRDGPRMVND